MKNKALLTLKGLLYYKIWADAWLARAVGSKDVWKQMPSVEFL